MVAIIAVIVGVVLGEVSECGCMIGNNTGGLAYACMTKNQKHACMIAMIAEIVIDASCVDSGR